MSVSLGLFDEKVDYSLKTLFAFYAHNNYNIKGMFKGGEPITKEPIDEVIEEMDTNESLLLKEQIRLLKKAKTKAKSKYTLEEVRKLTSSSKSNWADDIIRERNFDYEKS